MTVVLYTANILLINILISIISYNFNLMKNISQFNYKVNLFQYCERYIVAFENHSLGEVIIHPPPINFLAAMLVPMIVLKKEHMALICKGFSYGLYWTENLIFLVFFLFAEICLLPIVYIKTFMNILICSVGLFTIMFQCAVWLFTGFFYCIFMIGRDIYFLS